MKRFIATVFLALSLILGSAAPGWAAQPTTFQTEQQAQQHCPADVVVWLNVPSGVYHFKGQRWFGNTKNGAFVCQKEADSAGDRATKNGQ